MSHQFDPSILRAYDIRGKVDKTLYAADALAVGKAFATRVRKECQIDQPSIAVGYDGRLSSPELVEALIEGLTSAGAKVISVGLGPSPMLYFAVKKLQTHAGVMVTGSHNPAHHNGFKFVLSNRVFFGDDIQELGRIAVKGHFSEGVGAVTEQSVFDEYIDVLANTYCTGNDQLKVAWDAGNGATGECMVALTECLPGEHILINEKIDGNFPAHHPDPTLPENLEQLIDVVRNEQCDIGLAFDGDGDRIGVVDDTGRIVWGDQQMMLYAEDVLRDNPGAMVIADVKVTQGLFDRVAELGGEPLIWKTGHSFIKAKMAETGALLAGEISGHIFFADKYYGYDDALYAAVRLLNFVSGSDQKLSEMVDALPQAYSTPEIRIKCPEDRKFAIVEAIKQKLSNAGVNISEIDGVRVQLEESWWLLRASNTQAALSVRCEGKTEEALEIAKSNLAGVLEAEGIDIKYEQKM